MYLGHLWKKKRGLETKEISKWALSTVPIFWIQAISKIILSCSSSNISHCDKLHLLRNFPPWFLLYTSLYKLLDYKTSQKIEREQEH